MIYRLERYRDRSGQFRYYLAKDIRFRERKLKARVFIGTKKPSHTSVRSLSKKYAYEIERKAVEKLAGLATESYSGGLVSQQMVRDIEEIRFTYKSLESFMATVEAKALEHDLVVKYVHGTTFIEGNTLTLKETSRLWDEGILPARKKLREIYEVENFKKVLAFRTRYKRHIDGRFIRRIHRLIMDNIDHEMAGRYRRTDAIGIAGVDISLTPALLIEEELNELIAKYYNTVSTEGVHPFEAAVLFHFHFERIHPFNDGNGRTGRELLNYQLQRGGYPPFILSGAERDRYLDSLGKADQGDMKGLIDGLFDLYSEFWLERLRKNMVEFTC